MIRWWSDFGEKIYQVYEATVKDTGCPIDGHRMIFSMWRHMPGIYSLLEWREKDDEALMMTLFQKEVGLGFVAADGLDKFKRTWAAGEYKWPGRLFFSSDNVCELVEIETPTIFYEEK